MARIKGLVTSITGGPARRPETGTLVILLDNYSPSWNTSSRTIMVGTSIKGEPARRPETGTLVIVWDNSSPLWDNRSATIMVGA